MPNGCNVLSLFIRWASRVFLTESRLLRMSSIGMRQTMASLVKVKWYWCGCAELLVIQDRTSVFPITSVWHKQRDETRPWHIWHLLNHSLPIIVTYFYLNFYCHGFTFHIFFFHSAPEEGLYRKPKYRAILFKIIWSIIPFYLILVISVVGISVPSIFCILIF